MHVCIRLFTIICICIGLVAYMSCSFSLETDVSKLPKLAMGYDYYLWKSSGLYLGASDHRVSAMSVNDAFSAILHQMGAGWRGKGMFLQQKSDNQWIVYYSNGEERAIITRLVANPVKEPGPEPMITESIISKSVTTEITDQPTLPKLWVLWFLLLPVGIILLIFWRRFKRKHQMYKADIIANTIDQLADSTEKFLNRPNYFDD